MSNILKKITEFSKMSMAIFGFGSTVISVLIWIGVQVSNISQDFKKAVSIVPVVEQNTKDIDYIKQRYLMAEDYKKDINEIEQKYILTEIDFMINETLTRIYRKQNIGMVDVNRLIFYKNNLSFLTNQQINNINYIERVADKQTKSYNLIGENEKEE